MIEWGLVSLGNSFRDVLYILAVRECRLKANVSKSAVMTFGKGSIEGNWKWRNRISRGY